MGLHRKEQLLWTLIKLLFISISSCSRNRRLENTTATIKPLYTAFFESLIEEPFNTNITRPTPSIDKHMLASSEHDFSTTIRFRPTNLPTTELTLKNGTELSTLIKYGTESTRTLKNGTQSMPGFGRTVASNNDTRIPLYIGGLIPFVSNSDRYHYGSALSVAARLINEHPGILPDHRIELKIMETGGRVGFAITNLIWLLEDEKERKVAIVGPGKSQGVKMTAQLCSSLGVLQMSFSGIDPNLGDKELFATLFTSNPSRLSLNHAQVSLFHHNNWTRTAILYDIDESMGFQTAEELSELLTENSIEVLALEAFTKSRQEYSDYDVIAKKVHKFKQLDARVIVVGMGRASLKYVFCEAYKQRMYGPRYLWIVMFEDSFTNWYEEHRERDNVNCTREQLLEAADGFMYLSFANLRRDGVKTIAGYTADFVWQEVEKKVKNLYGSNMPKEFHYNLQAIYTYDGLWALAVLLDRAMRDISHFTIDGVLTRNKTLMGELTQLMGDIKFQGASGYFSYVDSAMEGTHTRRDRVGNVNFIQFSKNDTSYNEVGHHKAETGQITIDSQKQKQLFGKDYVFPKHGPRVVYTPRTYSLGMLIPIWVFAAFGILLSFIFLVGNIKYRNVGLIKLSSPNINNTIAIGCIFCYLAVALDGLDARTVPPDRIPTIYSAVVVMLSIGFTLAFGGLFSKTWRIYRIFTHTRSISSNGIRDIHLFGIMFALFMIDVFVFVTWTLVSPFYLHLEKLTPVIDTVLDTVEISVLYRCKSKYQNHFYFTVLAYKGLLLAFGLFVAWETRNIKIAAINDSRFIGMAVYNVAVLAIISALGTSSLQGTVFIDSSFVTFSVSIIICTTVTLCLVFVPKLKILSKDYNDPHFKNGRPILSLPSVRRRKFVDSTEVTPQLEMRHQGLQKTRSLTGASVVTNSTNASGSYCNHSFDVH